MRGPGAIAQEDPVRRPPMRWRARRGTVYVARNRQAQRRRYRGVSALRARAHRRAAEQPARRIAVLKLRSAACRIGRCRSVGRRGTCALPFPSRARRPYPCMVWRRKAVVQSLQNGQKRPKRLSVDSGHALGSFDMRAGVFREYDVEHRPSHFPIRRYTEAVRAGDPIRRNEVTDDGRR